MDGEKFDQLTRLLAGDASRRSVLRRMTGGALGGVAALVGIGSGRARTGGPNEPCPAGTTQVAKFEGFGGATVGQSFTNGPVTITVTEVKGGEPIAFSFQSTQALNSLVVKSAQTAEVVRLNGATSGTFDSPSTKNGQPQGISNVKFCVGGNTTCTPACTKCQVCKNGQCKPKTCPDGKVCNPDTGQCENPCANCTKCQVCKNGQCKDKTCDNGQVCNPDTGNCETPTCTPACTKCQVCKGGVCKNKECGGGQVCDEETGNCFDPCSRCTKCETCVNGTCVSKTCPNGRTCNPTNGECVCGDGTKPCGDKCIDEDACCTDDTEGCGGDPCQICKAGECKPKGCPPGQTCRASDGVCIVPPPCNPACPASSTCLNGSCCPSNQVCGNVCLTAPCSNDACQVCDPASGTCVSKCDAGEDCVNGTCEGPDPGACVGRDEACSRRNPCCSGLACVDGICVPGTVGTVCDQPGSVGGDSCERPLRCCGQPDKRGGPALCSRVVCKPGYRPQGGAPNGPRCECCGGGICSRRFIKRLVQR